MWLLLLSWTRLATGARESPLTRALYEAQPLRPAEEELSLELPVTDAAREAIDETLASRAFHGTTTVAFCFDGGVACAVDSRASMGSYVGSSKTEKVIPFSRHVLGTMAGSAADCSHFIRLVSARAKLHELEEGERLTTAAAARVLATALRRQPRGLGLSVGTMIMGIDDGEPGLVYVDSEGSRVDGTLFAVGSGSTFAYSVLDAEYRPNMDKDAALALVEKAVLTAANRDAYSGGIVNVYFVDKHTGLWSRVKRLDSDDILSRSDR
ncbi:hypothetical protein CTAYLR_005745 [Chrysophaeum taylorii]|uniref:Proteasome subunit beta n=1 Tax=Chrysophaeum taylorii TaxID=2483200 RepID=A0AAD7UJD7_9STRA|nr:hypothetical protein CTAYLR_005745 [Chrysophaeum taylorii]